MFLVLKVELETWDGRLIAAGRALARLSSKELAEKAGVTPRTVVRIEAENEIQVSEKKRHGCVSRETWDKLIGVLATHGVELFRAEDGKGAGVRLRSKR